MTVKKENKQKIRTAVDGAKVVTAVPVKKKKDKVKQVIKSYHALDEDCPVTALGLHDDIFYYIDSCRQLRHLAARDHSRLNLQALFSLNTGYLQETWPRINEDGRTTGWKPEVAALALMSAAAKCGIINIFERVRGPGAWEEDGKLVLHCGDIIYYDDKSLKPCQIEKHLYPSAPVVPRPAPASSTGIPAEKLLKLFNCWNWRRKELDAYLLLGWIGASMLGGALQWRPMAWMTGDKATGKSTIHDVLKAVHGTGGLIHATDPTAAGLWQSVGHASLPIALDEMESETDNRKNQNIIKFARHAASGGLTLRGGSGHKGTSFIARSCFLFSSILVPPLTSQDQSRIVILQLDKLEPSSKPPVLKPKELAEFGAVFRRRLMDQWPRFEKTLNAYCGGLQKYGHGGRSCDLFGTLLTCADLLLYDQEPESGDVEHWSKLLKRSTLSEAEDDISDSERCFSHLLSTICDVYRDGKKRTIGSWIEQAAGSPEDGIIDYDANKVLGTFGIRIEKPINEQTSLLIANTHQGLAGIFRDTIWAGAPGATGVWVQSVRRVEGAEAGKAGTSFDGAPARYTRVPLKSVVSL